MKNLKLTKNKFYEITVQGKADIERYYRAKFLGENEEFYFFFIDAGKIHYKIAKERIKDAKLTK